MTEKYVDVRYLLYFAEHVCIKWFFDVYFQENVFIKWLFDVYFQEHVFIKKYEREDVDVAAWFSEVSKVMAKFEPSW